MIGLKFLTFGDALYDLPNAFDGIGQVKVADKGQRESVQKTVMGCLKRITAAKSSSTVKASTEAQQEYNFDKRHYRCGDVV